MGDSSVSRRLVAQLCAVSCAGAAPPRLVQSETVHFAEHVMPLSSRLPIFSLCSPQTRVPSGRYFPGRLLPRMCTFFN